MAVDGDNNIWTGGLYNHKFQKLYGTTGAPVPGAQFNLGSGGYGGLVDPYGALWSANYPMLRFDTLNWIGNSLGISCYGVGINPLDCHIFVSSASDMNNNSTLGVAELDPNNGNVLNQWNSFTDPNLSGGGQGICVDGDGDVWVAQGNHVAHLAQVGGGHCFVGNVTGFFHVTGVAVDSNGRIWATDQTANKAIAIDPLAGGPGNYGVPVGEIMPSLTVDLGAGAGPYNYSDMTGAVLLGTSRSGFWDFIQEASPGAEWGTVSWNAHTPPGTSLTVEVRAANDAAGLGARTFAGVGNNYSICGKGITGRYLEVRVTFKGVPCSTISPILYDLTVQCCPQTDCGPGNHLPTARCPDPVVVCPGGSSTVTLSAFVADADGDPFEVSWREGSTVHQVSTIPAGGPPSSGTVTFTHTYPPGQTVITLALNDGTGFYDVCNIPVSIGDITPPDLHCPDGISAGGFVGSVPNFLPDVTVSDNCTPTPDILLTQTPPPGTQKTCGNYGVTITATDAAGNTSTCQTSFSVWPPIAIVSPANYAVFTVPATMVLVAEVGKDAGPVQEVRFLQGSAVVSTAKDAPYRATFSIDAPGFYPLRAQAVNPDGVVATSDTIQILVNSASPGLPVIISPPQDQTVCAGSNATFSVVADSSLPLSYEWRFNGTPIPEATKATLTVVNVQPADAGSYAVFVVNAAGGILSPPATLTLSAPPELWMKDKMYPEVPEDMGFEPNPDTGAMWISRDIWVRFGQDALTLTSSNPGPDTTAFVDRYYEHEHIPQDPVYVSPTFANYVYVKVRNACTQSAPYGDAKLRVYWALNSTGLPWPGGSGGGVWHELTGSPHLLPPFGAGQDYVAEFQWVPPDPSAWPAGEHPCLLARIEFPVCYSSDPFGMTFPEGPDLYFNVNRNNNIVQRNVTLLTGTGGGGTVIVRNTLDRTENLTLQFSVPPTEIPNHFLLHGDIFVKLSEELFTKWLEGGKPLIGCDLVPGSKQIRITNASNAVVGGLRFNANEEQLIDVRFQPRQNDPVPDGSIFNFDVAQLTPLTVGSPPSTIGGVRFQYVVQRTDALNWSVSGTTLTLKWYTGVLQETRNVAGPWTDLPNATSPYSEPMSAARKFFRVRF